MKIIDFNCELPTREAFEIQNRDFPEFMFNYLRIFGPRMASVLGFDSKEYASMLEEKDYEKILERIGKLRSSLSKSLEDFVGVMESMGIVHAVINCKDNHYTAEVVSRHPERFTGYAQVDVHKGASAVKALEEAVSSMGLRGLYLSPFMDNLHANHRRYYPLYYKCIELGIPVSIHCSMHYATGRSTDFSRPIYLDDVAMDFPELTVIARLGGWPWVQELVGLALKHLNIYINIASHRPRYLGTSGVGWEPLLHFGQNLLKERILFGSAWITLGMSLKEVYNEFEGLPIDNDAKDSWRYGNAARLLGRGDG
jgi:predicted TIM-barrel fold metal-dependent hydrolase